MIKSTLKISLLVGGMAASALSADASVINIVNGGFESTTVSGAFSTYGIGSTSLTGWDITAGNIDHIRDYWVHSEGFQSIDLTGDQAGTISQSILVPASGTVRVNFDLAGNANPQEIKYLTVFLDSYSQAFTFNTAGYSYGNMGWVPETAVFTGISAGSHVLKFTSGNPNNNSGPALDNVSASVPDGGSTCALLGMGLVGIGFLRRKLQA